MQSLGISIAYSPDTDDAFMLWALRQKLLPWGRFDFAFHTTDIEQLNHAAEHGTYDITAISIAAWPHISSEYVMIPVGGSVARSRGPAIVTSSASSIQTIADLRGRLVAIPGVRTSAALAAGVLLPPFHAVIMPFDKIADAISADHVDGGILIHELQLSPEDMGLRCVGNLGTLWRERFSLPLPLGTNAIRRSLGAAVITELTVLLRKSIDLALSRRDEAINYARQAALTITDFPVASSYIAQFVNRDSQEIQTDVAAAVELLYQCGTSRGAWATEPPKPYFFNAAL